MAVNYFFTHFLRNFKFLFNFFIVPNLLSNQQPSHPNDNNAKPTIKKYHRLKTL